MGKSIFVADSDDQSREKLKRLLQIFGYEDIAEAKNGAEALESIARKQPNIAFLDMNLAKLDGLLLCEILHHTPRFKDISVALMSASTDSALMESGLTAGAYTYLEKPISPESLKNALGGKSMLAPSETKFPDGMSKQAQAVVSEIAESARRTLNLLFGQGAKVIGIERASAELLGKSIEIVGQVKANGTVPVEIGMAFSESLGKALCRAIGTDPVDNKAIFQSVAQVLGSIMTRSLGKVSEIYPVTPEEPSVKENSTILSRTNIKESYTVHLRAATQSAVLRKQFGIPLVVAIGTA